MRHTFFAQFVAGESAAETEPLIADLYDRSCGAMLNWSAEAQHGGESTHAAAGQETSRIIPEAVGELTRAIQAVAKFRPQDAQKTTMMAIKSEIGSVCTERLAAVG
jgi:proline dehydrogenase